MTEEVFTLIMDIGELMLKNGAEVHRAEDSIKRMCRAFGAERCDVFVITSSMIVSIHLDDGTVLTQTRRITSTGIDFEKVHRLNQVSRYICREMPDADTIRAEIKDAENCKKYPVWLEYTMYAVIASAFTMFFGGGAVDGAFSLIIGIIVCMIVKSSEKLVQNKLFSNFFSSLIATVLAYIAYKLGWITNIDKVLIGNIMTLIPGIGITNAFRDLFTGDSIASALRMIEAVLSALAIAAGYILVAFVGGAVL